MKEFIFGILAGAIVGGVLAQQKTKRRRPASRRPASRRPARRRVMEKAPGKLEFKKVLVSAVLVTYFIGVAIGIYIVMEYDAAQLNGLLTFIGAPTTGAILSYCYVVRTENAIKLKRKYPEETEGISVDVNNTDI